MTSTSAARNSTPAVNLLNENPSLIALGKKILKNIIKKEQFEGHFPAILSARSRDFDQRGAQLDPGR